MSNCWRTTRGKLSRARRRGKRKGSSATTMSLRTINKFSMIKTSSPIHQIMPWTFNNRTKSSLKRLKVSNCLNYLLSKPNFLRMTAGIINLKLFHQTLMNSRMRVKTCLQITMTGMGTIIALSCSRKMRASMRPRRTMRPVRLMRALITMKNLNRTTLTTMPIMKRKRSPDLGPILEVLCAHMLTSPEITSWNSAATNLQKLLKMHILPTARISSLASETMTSTTS